MAVRAVFFDFGGTLVESRADLGAMFRAAGHAVGLEVPWGEFLQANDALWEEMWPTASHEIGRRPSFADQVHARALRAVGVPGPIEPMVERIRAEAVSPRWHRPFPETEEVLAELHQRAMPVHLLSNNVDYLPILLANLGWSERFGSVTYSQEIGVSKPDPRLFSLALERAGCAPDDALYVGDSWDADVVGAQGAGLRPVWLNRGGALPRAEVPMIADLRGVLPLLE